MTFGGARNVGINRSRFLFILAALGLNFAYMPLLVLLLPRRIESLFGLGATSVFSWLLFIGAVTASVANIAAGQLGDEWLKRHGNRRGLIAIGLSVLIVSFVPIAFATEPTSLIMAIIIFQIGLNLAMSPMMAVLADHIPADQKGATAGLIGAAFPLSALGTTILGWAFPVDSNMAFFASAGLVLICAAPLILCWRFEPFSQHDASRNFRTEPNLPNSIRSLASLWLARLLVQLSAGFVLLYLFLHVAGLIARDPAWRSENATDILSIISLLAASLAAPAAAFSGRLSDRFAARQTMLVGALILLFLSLMLLGSNPAPPLFGIAFILFQVGLTAYLSVDTALVAQLVSNHPKRGRILGVMNLTNTLPAILAPLVTLKLSNTPGKETPYSMMYMLSAIGILFALTAVYWSFNARCGGSKWRLRWKHIE